MKLESVTIKRFRSIDCAELNDCGDFNVLIGKNNSGKSNILMAIQAFFDCIENGNVVNLHPRIGKELDFFGRRTELPIEIIPTFSFSLDETRTLLEDISEEDHGQDIVNSIGSLDSIDVPMKLYIAIDINSPPGCFSFVREIAVDHASFRNTMLSISREAAMELYSRFSQLEKDLQYIYSIQNNATEWFQNAKGKMGGTLSLRPLPWYNVGISPELSRKLELLLNLPFSFVDPARKIQNLEKEAEEKLRLFQVGELSNDVLIFGDNRSTIPWYVKRLLHRISGVKVLYMKEERELMGPDEAKRLLDLKTKRGGFEIFDDIRDVISSLLGMPFDAYRNGGIDRVDIDNFLVEVSGSGIREALKLIIDFESEKPVILLVEEPEMHLHPSLETIMMRYLKRLSSHCQVFITTHSTNFLDMAEMRNVYLISKPESTLAQLLDFEEAEAEIPRELGIRLSSLFMFDHLVFVEGLHDEYILREWSSILGINLSEPNVGFILMEGARNFTHFAADTILSFLTKRQVRMWFLIDRDEKDEPEIVKLQERAGGRAVVKVLGKREIENYLLRPRAIVEFIRLKRELSPNGNAEELLTESDVQKTLEDCAEELKEIAVCKRAARILCKPVYPSLKQVFDEAKEDITVENLKEEIQKMIAQLQEANDKAEQVYKECSDYVDGVWQSRKLDIVPGDLLLDSVCEQYGVRFKKKQGDGERLAALMNEDEIDQEIKDIILEIGSQRMG